MKAIFVVLLLSGCATVIDAGRPPPSDWPQLKETVIHTSSRVAKQLCASEKLDYVDACTIIAFSKNECNIYTTTDDPDVMAHERMHCKGYDHVGSTTLRDAWEKWKRETRKRL